MSKDNVVSLFETIAKTNADRFAIEETDRRYTYAQLSIAVNEVASVMRTLRVKHESVVGVLLPSGFSVVNAMMAIFKAGAVYLPMAKEFQHQRLIEILSEIDSGIIITNEANAGVIRNIPSEHRSALRYVIMLDGKRRILEALNWEEVVVDQSADIQFPALSGEDSNYIFYSSGSTGSGKPILGKHNSLHQFITWQIEAFDIQPGCKIAQLGQITFDASLKDILPAICSGATLCTPKHGVRYNIPELIHWLRLHAVTIIQITPSLLRQILGFLHRYPEERNNVASLTHLMLSGEMVYSNDIQKIRQYIGSNILITNLYGTTESTILKTFHKVGEVPSNPATPLHVGQPIRDAVVAIMADGRLCAPGEIGEIFIKTKYLTKGYYKRPEETEKIFVQNPLIKDKRSIIYRTGDQGRYTNDGNIEVIGRLDDQVKINGIRIHLKEIENKIMDVARLDEVVVLKKTGPDFSDELVCFYASPSLNEESIRKLIGDVFHVTVIPALFIRVDRLPYNINGKIDRGALLKMSNARSTQQGEECSTEVERKVETVWKSILGDASYPRNCSFFHVGGSSLKAIQLIYRLHKEHDIVLTIGDIFRNPTIQELADLLQKRDAQKTPDMAPAEEQQYYGITHSQKRHILLESDATSLPVYNMTTVFSVNKSVELTILEKAFQCLIDRHEILRTNFVVINGEIKQRVHRHRKFRVTLINARTFDNEMIDSLVGQEVNKKFDIYHDSLIRCSMIQTSGNNIIVVSVNHLVSDAWSTRLMMEEVSKNYNDLTQGKAPNDLPLKFQYKDFTRWSNERLEKTKDELKSFWLKTLQNYADVSFPTDFERPERRTFRGKKIFFQFEQSTSNEINEMCKKSDLSTFHFFVSAFKILVARSAGVADLTIGVTITNRNYLDLENQIGLYLNNIPVRSKLESEETFSLFASKLKAFMLKAYDHALYPYDLLVEDVVPRPLLNRNPLYDVLFVMDGDYGQSNSREFSQYEKLAHALELEPVAYEDSISKLDLSLFCYNRNGVFSFMLEYSSELFKEATILTLVDDYKHIVGRVIADPNTTISDLMAFNPTRDNDSILLQNISEISSDLQ